MNIREAAQNYVAPKFKTIADFERIPVDLELKDETHQDKDGKDFTIQVAEIEGVKVRVPKSVIAQLQTIMSKMPNLQAFSVIKSGEGLDTSYQVVPFNS